MKNRRAEKPLCRMLRHRLFSSRRVDLDAKISN